MNKIIVHEDLDGIASAALLVKATGIMKVIFSDELENVKSIKIGKDTIIADLAYDERCDLWFDHHISHKTNKKFKGSFKLEKSCARVIYNYYQGNFSPYYKRLTNQLDKADSGDFTKEDVENDIPIFRLNFLLLLYQFKEKERKDILKKILGLMLNEIQIGEIIKDKKIATYLNKYDNLIAKSLEIIKQKKEVVNKVLIIDSSDKSRVFPLFQTYILYPEINYLLIINKTKEKHEIGFLIVKNKFKDFNYVNIGRICKYYGGGGHKEIGGFRIYEKYKSKILEEVTSKLS